jgi:hypothetical protein
MPRKPFDPLTYIPSPEVIQGHLDQTEQLARRLRILLRVAREIQETEGQPEAAASGREVRLA